MIGSIITALFLWFFLVALAAILSFAIKGTAFLNFFKDLASAARADLLGENTKEHLTNNKSLLPKKVIVLLIALMVFIGVALLGLTWHIATTVIDSGLKTITNVQTSVQNDLQESVPIQKSVNNFFVSNLKTLQTPEYKRTKKYIGDKDASQPTYLPNAPILNKQNRNKIHINNTSNALIGQLIDKNKNLIVRQFFIPENKNFALKNISNGNYYLRFLDLKLNQAWQENKVHNLLETSTRKKLADGRVQAYIKPQRVVVTTNESKAQSSTISQQAFEGIKTQYK